MRPVIPFLLLAALTIGGCDKQSAPQSQANETISNSAPAESAGNASAGSNELRRLDRSHKGETAPDVAFLDPAGGKTRIADFKGKPLLMNLWATWCAPCVKEMPTLDALAERLGDSAVVLVLAQDTPEKVDPFFQKAGFKRLQPYIDQDSAMSLTMGLNLPTTILYDSSGREVWRMAGEMDWSNDTARDLIAEAK